jgi:hypothetical protein
VVDLVKAPAQALPVVVIDCASASKAAESQFDLQDGVLTREQRRYIVFQLGVVRLAFSR